MGFRSGWLGTEADESLALEELNHLHVADPDTLDLIAAGHVLLDKDVRDPNLPHRCDERLEVHCALADLGELRRVLGLDELLEGNRRVFPEPIKEVQWPSG